MAEETVLITGCSSGIGRATARAFIEEDWTVYATARNPEDVDDLEDRGAETAALDVTEPSQVESVVDRVIDEQGVLDCLVNNAGYAQMGPVEDVEPSDFHRQFDVNVYGPHRLARAVLPAMRRAEDGTIVNVSSAAGRLTVPGAGAYSASKHALGALSDAMRPEVAPFGVDVVLVEPGPVETAFDDRAQDELDELERSGVYESVYHLYEDVYAVSGVGAVQPEAVATTILNAAVMTDPAPRLPVGPVASAASLAGLLPSGWRDAAYRLASKLAR
jgi:NAD(P)-dependent dehydrogenase (short-subunit alcohol dehydrogenase family)